MAGRLRTRRRPRLPEYGSAQYTCTPSCGHWQQKTPWPSLQLEVDSSCPCATLRHSAHPTEGPCQWSVLAWDHDSHDDLHIQMCIPAIVIVIDSGSLGLETRGTPRFAPGQAPLEAHRRQARGPGRRGPGAIALWGVSYTASAGAHTLGAAGRAGLQMIIYLLRGQGDSDGAPEEGAEPARDLGSTGSFAVKGVLNR